jgi:hypothetical protein
VSLAIFRGITMNWDDILAGDALAFFETFAETKVVIRPGEGRPRVVDAIVDYSPPARLYAGQPGTHARVVVMVRNHGILGIDPAELDLGTWKIDIAIRRGRFPEPRPIEKLLRADGGEVHLLVR